MSELNFSTQLIRLTKATLTIVMCCVKIQNNCSESFGTRQGLRQGNVLSTLLFNVVLNHLRSSHLDPPSPEIWVLTKKEENQLLVFERKVLRTISGPKIENGVCRRRYNHDLDEEIPPDSSLDIHFEFLDQEKFLQRR
jgi:hypothetical protein